MKHGNGSFWRVLKINFDVFGIFSRVLSTVFFTGYIYEH